MVLNDFDYSTKALSLIYMLHLYVLRTIVINLYFGEIKIRIFKWRSCETHFIAPVELESCSPSPSSCSSFFEGIKRRMGTVNYMGRASRRLYRHVGLNLYDQPLSRGRISSAIGALFPSPPPNSALETFAATETSRRRLSYGKAARVIRVSRRAGDERVGEADRDCATPDIQRMRERRMWRST